MTNKPARPPRRKPSASTIALEQATAIARSASGTTIDWTREPLTERERKIRRAMLEQILADGFVTRLGVETLIPYGERHRGAQDCCAALTRAVAVDERRSAEIDRQQLEDAIAAVDDDEEGVA